jgi:hypothetical protein
MIAAHPINRPQTTMPTLPAKRAAAGSPLPSSCPILTVIAELKASGTMNIVDAKFTAI